MKHLPCSLLLAMASAWWLALDGFGGSSSATVPAIPRFQAVTESVFRGGQPTEAGFRFLRQKGIKTVINLREENGEKALVESLGMKYVHLPSRARDPIPEEAIQTFFRVIQDPASHPIFIHCERGADRTGAMVGLYRIAFQGWDGKRAYEEARAMGMRWWYRDLRRQLYEFAAKRSTSQDRRGRSAGPARPLHWEYRSVAFDLEKGPGRGLCEMNA